MASPSPTDAEAIDLIESLALALTERDEVLETLRELLSETLGELARLTTMVQRQNARIRALMFEEEGRDDFMAPGSEHLDAAYLKAVGDWLRGRYACDVRRAG